MDHTGSPRKRQKALAPDFVPANAAVDFPTPPYISQQTSPSFPSTTSNLPSERVRCNFTLVHNNKTYQDLKDCEIQWVGKSEYQRWDTAATQCLRGHGVSNDKYLYRKSGRCSLIREDSEVDFDCKILENERQWSEVLYLLVSTFCSKSPYVPFRLEIHWEYADLSIKRIPRQKFATAVQLAIRDKFKKNWRGKKFIPRGDLDAIFSRDTITELINADRSLDDVKNLDKATFCEDVIRDASRLLALCVYVKLRLDCLYRLIQQGYKDTSLPLTEPQCPKEVDRVKFENLIQWQGAFIAHKFTIDRDGPEHRQIPDEVVVPITFNRNTDKLGEGGFGEVFRVHIDADHHRFTADRTTSFALKIFKEIGSRTDSDFKRESETLSTLSKLPHDHITLHLASWTQDNRFYMLFPCAETNLGNFLRVTPRPELDDSFMTWLLSQLKGIADGVRHIHNLAPSGLGPDSLNNDLKPGVRRARTGFHHDLKPQNILVFAKDASRTIQDDAGSHSLHSSRRWDNLILKISDFGTARINVILSQSQTGIEHTSYKSSSLSHGDTAYGAPDYALEQKTSRPYDIWSLGCIFFEVILWAAGPSGTDLGILKFDRLTTPRSQGHQNDAFWYRDITGGVHLKPAVRKQLKMLRSHCKDKGVFKHLVSGIAQMLCLLPQERIDAPSICNILDTQLLQLRIDLKTSGYYKNEIRGHRGREVAAPPSIYEDKSDMSSIVEGSFPAPEDGLLHAEHDHHQQPRHSHGTQPNEENNAQTADSRPDTARGRLYSLQTNLPPSLKHRRSSPSITLSREEDRYTTQVLEDMNESDGTEDFPPIVSYAAPVGLEEIYQPGRQRSRSSDSRRMETMAYGFWDLVKMKITDVMCRYD